MFKTGADISPRAIQPTSSLFGSTLQVLLHVLLLPPPLLLFPLLLKLDLSHHRVLSTDVFIIESIKYENEGNTIPKEAYPPLIT